MFAEFFSSGTLNIVYAGVVIISFLFVVLTLIGAEIGDAFDFAFDGEGDFDFINISPFAMAMFGSTFGLVGLITRVWLDMEAIPSILWASGIGFVVGGLAQALFIYILSPSKSSHYSLVDDAIGREAEVIITIPDNGRGQITFNNVSGRVTLGARSATGNQIRTGDLVVIEKIVGQVAIVRPADEK